MKEIKLKGFDKLQKEFDEYAALKKIPVTCPHCEKIFVATLGANACPHCGKVVEVQK